MTTDLPYPIDKGSTHWEGCYRERRHHNCAVIEVDRLRAENERLRAVAAQVLTHYSASLDYQPPYVRMAREALGATDDD